MKPLLTLGRRKLEREFPLNQKLREKKDKGHQRRLEVPSKFRDFAKLCRIRSGTQIIPFTLYEWQEKLSDLLDLHKKAVIFKTRQLGVTELLACKMLHRACLNRAYAAAVLSLGGEETGEVARRVREMPSRVQNFGFESEAITNLQVEGGGFIKFRPSTNNAVRSLPSIQTLLFDEAAFVGNQSEIYAGAAPSQEMVGDQAETWVVSTMSPSGKLCWFWSDMFGANNGNVDVEEKLKNARAGIEPFSYWIDSAGWLKVIIHWRCHPIYSQIPNYLEKTKREKKLTQDKLDREYDLGIPESGGLFFKPNLILQLAKGSWADYDPIKKYLAGIDPNFGGDDYFCLQIWEISQKPYKLVRQFRKNKSSNTYNIAMSAALLKQYRPIITAVESNSGGAVVLENLITFCPNLRIEKVVTTNRTKEVNTDRLAYLMESQDLIYPPDWEACAKHPDESGDLVDGEFYQFSALERRALRGHDDTIMTAAAAFAWLEEALK